MMREAPARSKRLPKTLSDRQRQTFAAMWRARRSAAAIGATLDLTVKQVGHLRRALGLEPRNACRRKRTYVLMDERMLATLTSAAGAAGLPRQRFLAVILEREAGRIEARA